MPIISVIIPVYQVEAYIAKTVKSICNQTFRDFEIILVNDGTTDRSIVIAEEIIKQTEVEYQVIAQRDQGGIITLNQGLAAARNLGIAAARGDWVICIDSDDCIHPQMLELLLNGVLKNNTDCAFCDFKMVIDSGVDQFDVANWNCSLLTTREIATAFLLRKIPIIAPSILIKHSFMVDNDIWYPKGCLFSEDQYYIWQIISKVHSLSHVKCTLYNYLHRKNSIMTSSTIEKILSGYGYFCKLNEQFSEGNIDVGFDHRIILARWVLGATHTAAKILNYNDFVTLVKIMKTGEHMGILRGILKRKGFALSMTFKYFPSMFYFVVKGARVIVGISVVGKAIR